ncbi:MAG TPA: hypothetical protein VGM56_34000 [Byssovorax sp.]|jgi:hypothetical protein
MHSVRSFLVVWACVSALILGYAAADLALHPRLRRETHFSMQPDLSRTPELVHWGGRLIKEGRMSLLVANALILGGLGALAIGSLARHVRKREDEVPPREVARQSMH